MGTSGTGLCETLAKSARTSEDSLAADLADGRTITVPLGRFPRLSARLASRARQFRG
jgi:hypothetical protein